MKRRLFLGILVGSVVTLTAGLVGCGGGAGSSEAHTEGDTVKANETPKGASALPAQSTNPSGGGTGGAKTQTVPPSAQ